MKCSLGSSLVVGAGQHPNMHNALASIHSTGEKMRSIMLLKYCRDQEEKTKQMNLCVYLLLKKKKFFCFVVWGLKLKAFTLIHSTSPVFLKGFSRQSPKIFAQASFELRSS
jgi:hypothetical protein